jgi:hypothetical protein
MPTLMIVQVELSRNSDHEESDNRSGRSGLWGAIRFEAPRANFGAQRDISNDSLNPPRAELKLTTTVETS